MKLSHFKRLLIVWLLLSAAALFLFMRSPSETDSAYLFGYSKMRLLLAGILMLFILLQAWGLWFVQTKPVKAQSALDWLDRWLILNDHLYNASIALLIFFLLSLGAILLSWLIFPAVSRPILVLGSLLLLSLVLLVFSAFRKTFRQIQPPAWLRPLDHWKALELIRKNTLLVLAILSLLYFLLFIPVNLLYTDTEHTFYHHSGDEGVIYPILMSMFEPAETLHAQLYHRFIYEDYHYGYPFYAVSALAVLPARILFGADFAARVRINLLLLRQLVSVLPVILSALILVYMITRFRRRLYSIALFLFLLAVPGVVTYNGLFWHPDALAVLFVVLTLFFLQRDGFSFSHNWVFAAITCGIASAIRLLGFFCVLAVAYVLLYALIAKKTSFWKIVSAGAIFLLVMSAVIVISSPYLLMASSRANFAAIFAEKRLEMAFGYDQPDPENIYRTGWAAWLPFLEKHWGEKWFLLFAAVGLTLTSLRGSDRHTPRLIALWVVASLGYLIYFVAVKSFQYLLPPMLIFHSAAFNLPIWLRENRQNRPGVFLALEILCLALIAAQFVAWLAADWRIYLSNFP